MKLFGKPKRHSHATKQHHEPYVSQVQRVLDDHADCTAELFNIFVHGRKRVAPFSSLTPGDRMEMTLHGDKISFYTDGTMVAEIDLPESSMLPEAFKTDIRPEAFLGGRDVANASEDAEFATVIVFYKINGIPPTKIKIE